jgi:hypothetical protein
MAIKFQSVGAAMGRSLRDALIQREVERRERVLFDLGLQSQMRQQAREDMALQRQAQQDMIAADERAKRDLLTERNYNDAQARQGVLDQRYETERKDRLARDADQAGDRYLDTEREFYESNRAREDSQAHARQITAMQMGGRSGGSQKPPTQGQLTADSFYGRAKDALDTLEGVEGSISGWNRFVPNILQSEAGQVYEQSKRQFIEAYLRKDSGAAIADSEYGNADRTYFAQPGDSAATLRRKQEARRKIADTLKQQGTGSDGRGNNNNTGRSRYAVTVED